ncbi:MAG: restriction endonuclease subunit S [Bacteroidales bacterium]|mgnify:CR=1 FL=1|nr:restriction endonuclease subunit S [Bacteroidales bacterium]
MSKNLKYLPITSLLSEIIDNRGKSVPTSDKGLPLIATNCIKHSSIYPTFEKVRYIDEQTYNTWFRAHLHPNDILFVNKGTPGRVCLVPNPVNFCAAQDMMGFRCNEKLINYKYLFAILRSNEIQKIIENNHVGLVIPHMRKQDLPCLLIPIRSIEEQEAIGNLYITLSEKIELNNRINAELEAMAKTLYDYWFVQFDFPYSPPTEGCPQDGVGIGKPYKSSGGLMVWNEQLKRKIPEGWEVGNLLMLSNLEGGGTPSKANDEYWNGNIPFYTPTDYTNSIFTTTTQAFITQNGLDSCSSKLFSKGTIFITARGTVGNITIASTETAMNQSCYAFCPKPSIDYGFLYFSVKSLISILKAKSGGSVFNSIVSNDIKQAQLAIPPTTLIQKYADISRPIFEKIYTNTKQNQHLASLRDWLLPMLMNGQVTIAEAEKAVYNLEETMGVAAEPVRKYS